MTESVDESYDCELCEETFETPSGKGAHKRHAHEVTVERLVADLRRVGSITGGGPSVTEYDRFGDFTPGTIKRRIGTWGEALEAAGFTPSRTWEVSEDDVIDDIQRLAERLGRPPTAEEMRSDGEISVKTAQSLFGSWNEALRSGGFDPHQRHNIEETELLEAISAYVEEFGRVPTPEAMFERGRFSPRPYYRHWEGWPAAVRAAGYEPVGRPSGPDNPQWKSDITDSDLYYGSNWREQRELALTRDGFECRSPGCELTDEDHRSEFGRGLHVHHVRPLASFESDGAIDYERANSLANLVTVCVCHHDLWERMSPLRPDTRQK